MSSIHCRSLQRDFSQQGLGNIYRRGLGRAKECGHDRPQLTWLCFGEAPTWRKIQATKTALFSTTGQWCQTCLHCSQKSASKRGSAAVHSSDYSVHHHSAAVLPEQMLLISSVLPYCVIFLPAFAGRCFGFGNDGSGEHNVNH